MMDAAVLLHRERDIRLAAGVSNSQHDGDGAAGLYNCWNAHVDLHHGREPWCGPGIENFPCLIADRD
jgi:hypothetical protein